MSSKSKLLSPNGLMNIIIIAMYMLITPQLISAQNNADSIKQLIAELQKNSNDDGLKDKIISLSLTVNPTLAIPDDANEKLIMGITFRDGKDYKLAIRYLNEALLIAPWWGKGYKELGLTYEVAEKYDDAIRTFQLFIKTQPGADIISSVKEEIAICKAKKELAANKIIEEEELIKRKEYEKKNAFNGRWTSSTPFTFKSADNSHLDSKYADGLKNDVNKFDILVDGDGNGKVIQYYSTSIEGKRYDNSPREYQGKLVNGELVVRAINLYRSEFKNEYRFNITVQGLHVASISQIISIPQRGERIFEYDVHR